MKSMIAYMGVALLVGTAAFASGCKVTVIDDGIGGSGSTSATTKAATSTTTKAATGTTAASTTGGGTCDDIGTCQDGDMDTTNDCVSCSFDADCATEYGTCGANPDCVGLNNCYADCPDGDDACLDGCDTQFPDGGTDLNALVVCAICTACPNSCANPQCP